MPQPHQARIHFTPHCESTCIASVRCGVGSRSMCVFMREHRIVGISDVLHVHDHGVFDLAELVPGHAFRSEVEAEPEGSSPVGIDVIRQRRRTVGRHRDGAQAGHP